MTIEGIPAPASDEPKVVRFYLGDGTEYYAEIPARHLTENDYADLTDAQRELVDRGHVTGSKPVDVPAGDEPKYEEIRTRLYQKTKPSSRKEG